MHDKEAFKILSVYMPESLHERIMAIGKKQERTLSWWSRKQLEAAVEKEEAAHETAE